MRLIKILMMFMFLIGGAMMVNGALTDNLAAY